jgi:prepilin-type N-terminal cleavage/methylation domain-containing protein
MHKSNKFLAARRHARQSGFTLVELMIVVLIIATLLNIALPSLVKARDTSRAKACIRNLRAIQVAKEQWAMQNRVGDNTVSVTWSNISPFMKQSDGANGPVCPASGAVYTLGTINSDPQCPTYPASHSLTLN